MIPTVTVTQVSPDAHLLDVREADEWAAGHAPDAQHLAMSELPARLAEVPGDRPVVVVCRVGARSAEVTRFLLAQGWRDVHNLAGGMQAWTEAGRPLVTDTGGPGTVV